MAFVSIDLIEDFFIQTYIVGRVQLHNIVDCWDIQTSGSDICADQGSLLGVTELKEGVCTLLLLLLSMEC